MDKMDKMITQLTEQQIDNMSKYINKYTEELLVKQPTDDELIQATHKLYKLCKLDKPGIVLIADNPYHAQIMANMMVNDDITQVHGQVSKQILRQVWMQMYKQVHGQVSKQMYEQVWMQMYKQMWMQVYEQVHGQVHIQVYKQVHGKVREQVYKQVSKQMYGQVHGQVWMQVYEQVYKQVSKQMYGQVWMQVYEQVHGQVHKQVYHQVSNNKLEYYQFSENGNVTDYGWTALFDFFDNELGIIQNNSWDLWREIISTGFYDMIQFDNIAIIVRNPLRVKFSDNKDGKLQEGMPIIFNGLKYLFVYDKLTDDPELLEYWEIFDGDITKIKEMIRLEGRNLS